MFMEGSNEFVSSPEKLSTPTSKDRCVKGDPTLKSFCFCAEESAQFPGADNWVAG
jgi:hypothetical protein